MVFQNHTIVLCSFNCRLCRADNWGYYITPVIEAEWIRNGELFEYEGSFGILRTTSLDSEVMFREILGRCFSPRPSTRPYNRRIKFGSNIPSFENKVYDDQVTRLNKRFWRLWFWPST